MSTPDPITAQEVKRANRRLYDLVGGRYEEIDGRRTGSLEAWMREQLAVLRRRAGGGRLLDVGTGAGFVTRCARGAFDLRVGIDISPGVLAAARASFDGGIACDVDALPFRSETFDAVTCFAVLHHLYDPEPLVREVRRVLKPGGCFWSDHDLDDVFCRRFRLPLAIHRRIQNAKGWWLRADARVTKDLYEKAECHEEDGIDATGIAGLFAREGLHVETRFHWYGLFPLSDRLFGRRAYPRGWAPAAALWAQKPKG